MPCRNTPRFAKVSGAAELELDIDRRFYGLAVIDGAIAAHSETTIASTNRLRPQGVRVAIDDFGTGNSTLSFLDRLAVAEVKIDRSLVSAVGEPGRENPVVRHLVRLCHELGLDAVAEGVETERERAVLGSLGCRRGQGYLLARPMDPDRTATWLRRGAPLSEDRDRCEQRS